ncbi:MAG: hypothetical protein IKP67_00510 [Spirochaetales bacterium]|nr:hypothetical protein [Spirochaetales bacterium]
MKKIISLITIAAMMLCGIIACETEQIGSSQNEVTSAAEQGAERRIR